MAMPAPRDENVVALEPERLGGQTAFLLGQMVRAALREGLSAEYVRWVVENAIEERP